MAIKMRDVPRSIATREDGSVVRDYGVRVRQLEGRERTLEFAITTLAVNRYGEVDRPDGGRFEQYMKNPIVLFCHNSWDLPVARTMELRPSTQEVLAWAQFAGAEQMHPFAETVYRLYRDGFLTGASVGFKPITISEDRILPGQTGITVVEWELLEWSCVPVPANPDALKRFVRAFGLPDGANERDLMQATRLDPRKWFTVAKTIKPVTVRLGGLALRQDDGATIQTLILSKETFPEQEKADAWITDHNFTIKEGAPDETDESWRYRQFPPGDCTEGALENGETFASVEVDTGVLGVLCKRAEAEENAATVQLKRVLDPKVRLAIMERMQVVALDKRRVAYVGRAECFGKVDRFFFQCAPPPGKTAASVVSMTREDVRAIVEEVRRSDADVLEKDRNAPAATVRQVLSDESLEKLRTAHDLLGMVIAEEEMEAPMEEVDEDEDEGGEEVPDALKDAAKKKATGEEPAEKLAAHMESTFARLVVF